MSATKVNRRENFISSFPSSKGLSQVPLLCSTDLLLLPKPYQEKKIPCAVGNKHGDFHGCASHPALRRNAFKTITIKKKANPNQKPLHLPFIPKHPVSKPSAKAHFQIRSRHQKQSQATSTRTRCSAPKLRARSP